jgi:DNA repair exonuclease SbcCD nuclease subunit
MVTTLVIGDVHFQERYYARGVEFIKKIENIANTKKPEFIVVLGDVLDRHHPKLPAFELAELFISKLVDIAPTYVLIGNHDYIDNQQFLSERHWFNSFKRWKNPPIIVDQVISQNYGDKTFIFCPYVPPGRFIEALNTSVKDDIPISHSREIGVKSLCDLDNMWELADCIFCHQEFRGCEYHPQIQSKIGDKYDENYPTIISGHIHKASRVGKNIFYPGTPYQCTFGEDEDKGVWYVTFQEEGEFSHKKIDLHLKKKKTVYATVEEIDSMDFSLFKDEIKVKVEGDLSEITSFRKSLLYTDLLDKGIKFQFETQKQETPKTPPIKNSRKLPFISILKNVVDEKSEHVKQAYSTVFPSLNTKLQFEDSDTHESGNSDSCEEEGEISDDSEVKIQPEEDSTSESS